MHRGPAAAVASSASRSSDRSAIRSTRSTRSIRSIRPTTSSMKFLPRSRHTKRRRRQAWRSRPRGRTGECAEGGRLSWGPPRDKREATRELWTSGGRCARGVDANTCGRSPRPARRRTRCRRSSSIDLPDMHARTRASRPSARPWESRPPDGGAGPAAAEVSTTGTSQLPWGATDSRNARHRSTWFRSSRTLPRRRSRLLAATMRTSIGR